MKSLVTLLLSALCVVALAGPAAISSLSLSSDAAGSRLVVASDAPLRYEIPPQQEPGRLVVDLRDVLLAAPELEVDLARDGGVRGLHSASLGKRDLRLVLDVSEPLTPRAFLVEPKGKEGYRLVVELSRKVELKREEAGPPPAAPSAPPRGTAPLRSASPKEVLPLRDLVVVIDPGHGGHDPGAIGVRGTQEKEVVLAIAHKLEALVAAEPGMKPVLTRADDQFIELRGRMAIARDRRADLFVSIHADSYKDYGATGSSVYILSQKGASSEAARWLAESENNADRVGAVSLDDKDQMVASVLLDMSQTKTIESSAQVAGQVLSQLSRLGPLHSTQVQRAGFAVLKSPDVPSMLVETGFISNPQEERNLVDPNHQYRLAQAIMQGVRSYFSHHAPAGTWLAEGERPVPASRGPAAPPTRKVSFGPGPQRHTVGRGDTLYGIARLYRVSVESLKAANGLTGNELSEGKTLNIPSGRDS